jgi:hypothetical protein
MVANGNDKGDVLSEEKADILRPLMRDIDPDLGHGLDGQRI